MEMVSSHNFKGITIEDARFFLGSNPIFCIVFRSFVGFFRVMLQRLNNDFISSCSNPAIASVA
ncbi:MAG: hypothetical protein RLZZ597_2932 [Cyanobacteriota bacterium]|jgi:hypothetical protein